MLKKVSVLCLITMISSMPTSQAAVIKDKIVIKNKAVVTFSLDNTVALNSNGCKEVYIEYSIDKSYYFPKSYVMFGLYSKENNEMQSLYVKPGNGKGTQGSDPWVGDTELVFCGKAKTYTNEYGDKVEAPAFKKGTYTLTGRVTVLEPKLSSTYSKEHVFIVK